MLSHKTRLHSFISFH